MAAAAVDMQNQRLQDEMDMANEEVTSESNGNTSQCSIKGPDEPISTANFDFWSNHTGMKVKQFSDEELLAFRKPFQLGWRREVVLRGTVTNSGRKIGDVYYFSPDKKIKLRSYVEMGLFLKKNNQCGLEPENFTFARQPIYEPPAEIVRPAQTRGSNQPAEPDSSSALIVQSAPVAITFATPNEVSTRRERERSTVEAVSSSTTPDDGSSLVEGRAKRKRVAPARFEDEDFAEQSPIKKKPITVKLERTPQTSQAMNQFTPPIKISIKPSTSGGLRTPMIVTTPTVNQAPKQSSQITLQPIAPKTSNESGPETSLLTVVKTEIIPSENMSLSTEQSKKIVTETINGKPAERTKAPEIPTSTPSLTITALPLPQTANRPILPKPSLLEKNLTRQFKPIKPKPPPPVEITPISIPTEDSIDDGKTMIPPCSIMCGAQRGQLPSLLCSRCLCLFHPSCVPTGIYLDEPNSFVCPNCIQTGDKGSPMKITNGKNYDDGNHVDASSISESSPLPLKVCSSSRNSSRAASPTQQFTTSALKSRLCQTKTVRRSTPEQRFVAQLKLLQNYQQQTLRKTYQQLPSFKPTGDLLRDKLTGTSTPMNINRKQHIIKSKGGHLQIDHPMFHQSKAEPMKAKSILPPGLLSKGQHLQMSKIIQNQLQAFYQPTPIAPIAPIRVTPAQIATMLDQKTRNKYREYLVKNYPGVNRLLDGYSFLNSVLDYLTVKDLISLSGVNRSFRSLSNQAHLWDVLRLKGISIINWQAFGEKVVEYKSTEIDFQGIKIPSGTDLASYWKQFSSFIPSLSSVKKLKFGTIPKFVLEELSRSQMKFESLMIKNIFDENCPRKEVSLSILNQLKSMTSLEEIHVSCKNGLKVETMEPESLCNIFSDLLKLNSLSLTNMKGLTKEHFQFLEELSNLSSLEIGSCECWNESNQSSKEGVTIPFKYFQNLVRLQHLKLIDLIIDESSADLPVVMHHMKQLKSLSLDSVTITPDSQEILDVLAQTINNDLDEMKSLSLSTDDPPTNRLVTEFVKKLDNLDHFVWKVGTVVEDSGECVIPLSKERMDDSDLDADLELTNGHENTETIDVVLLTEQLEGHLPRTKVEILPQ